MQFKDILKHLLLGLNLIAVLMLMLCYLAPYVSPVVWWPLAFIALAYPFIVLLNLLFVIYWIVTFKINFIISLIAIAAGYNHLLNFIQLNAKKTVKTSTTLNIVDFNTHYMGAFDNRNADSSLFFNILNKINPDIICFQEFANQNGTFDKPMFKRFFREYKNFYSVNADPLSVEYPTGYGVCIFSRYPVIKSGFLESVNQTANLSLFADIVFNKDTIRVVNTHLKSISFDPKDYKTFEKIKKSGGEVEIAQVKPMLYKMRHAFQHRAKQAEKLREGLDDSPYKLIVTGDFNDSPTSYAYNTVKGKLKDAFRQSGIGLSKTYIGKMPSFRIDYILHNAQFKSYNYKSYELNFSDHKMISATIDTRP